MDDDAAAAATGTGAVRLLVYGSCVSRDTIDSAPPGEFSLTSYVARQSLVSAFSPPAGAVELPESLSPFQRRMVQGDVDSNLPGVVETFADSLDLLLWDLFDERLGLYVGEDGTVVTRSSEIVGSTMELRLARERRLVELGHDEHFSLWSVALGRWAGLLARTGCVTRTLVLAPPWASESSDGRAVPGSFGLGADRANRLYARYYEAIEDLGIPVVHVPEELAVAAHDHRWGPAPFHYQTAVYQRLLEGVATRTVALPPRRPTSGPGHEHAGSDLARWGAPEQVSRWHSIAEFAAQSSHRDGLHRIGTVAGTLDVYLIGQPLAGGDPARSVPVFFSGAVSQRAGSRGPHFSGLRMAREIGGPCVLVADTTMTHHVDITVGWYLGCQDQPLQQVLAALVDALSGLGRRRLLLVGGSGGAFAGLVLAADAGPHVSVLCWNAQTDVLRYRPAEVRAYTRSCFPELTGLDPEDGAGRERLRAGLASRGIRTVVPATVVTSGTRVLYLQNAADWHVQVHLLPWAEDAGLVRDGVVWSGGRTVVLMGAWGAGHTVPDRAAIAAAIGMLAQGSAAEDTAAALVAADPSAFAYPEAQRFLAAPGFHAEREDGQTLVVRAEISPSAARWLEFAFYAFDETGRTDARWYDSSADYVLRGDAARRATSVTCFVRDSEGRRVTLHLPLVPGQAPRSLGV